MRERRQKARESPGAELPPLPPAAAAALQDQVDRVAAGCAAGQDPDALRELVTPQPQDPQWDLHLMAALAAVAHPAVPPLLAALFGASPDKARRKALKKALHLLKTRRVPVPARLLPREAVSRGASAGATAGARVSPFFGSGESYIILEGPQELLGGNVLVARLSDQEGFRECHLLSLKRKQQTEFWDQFREQGLDQWITVPSPYAVRLLEEASTRTPPGGPGSARYASLRERIWRHWGRPEEGADPETFLPALRPEERGRLLEQARDLALDPLFHAWLPGVEEITPWMQRLKEVENSPLVLSPQQQQMRADAVIDEATQALYPPETRPRWRRRLLTTAYYLELQGRGEAARAAQAAAEDLAGERGPLSGENPFLQALVHYALQLAREMQKPREAPAASGLVVPPTDSLLIRR